MTHSAQSAQIPQNIHTRNIHLYIYMNRPLDILHKKAKFKTKNKLNFVNFKIIGVTRYIKLPRNINV